MVKVWETSAYAGAIRDYYGPHDTVIMQPK